MSSGASDGHPDLRTRFSLELRREICAEPEIQS